MKKCILLLIAITLLAFSAQSQTLERVSFTTGGNSTSTVSVSIGDTFTGIGNKLTLGSQQYGKILRTGVSNTQNPNNKVVVYPNPTNSFINVSVIGENQTNFAIKITNILGVELFYQANYNANAQIDLSTFPNGIFIICAYNTTSQLLFNQIITKQ